MPSFLHEALLQFFRDCPRLMTDLVRDRMCGQLPQYTDVRIESADLSEVQPTEYRADLIVPLSNGTSALYVIVEVQLSIDDRKRFSWPVYVATLRARKRCPVCLLVICADMNVARWAERPISMGCMNIFMPRVLSPDQVPKITDTATAARDPELAILSAVMHGRDQDAAKATQIAAAAVGVSAKLDDDRSSRYFDLILSSLNRGCAYGAAEYASIKI